MWSDVLCLGRNRKQVWNDMRVSTANCFQLKVAKTGS